MPNSEKTARIFIVDDHAAIRHGLTLLLSRETFEICGEARSVQDALGQIGQIDIDLAIIDLSLAEGSGFDLIAPFQSHAIPVVVYSMHENAEHIERSFNSGARAYVSKREETDILVRAIHEVLAGHIHLSPLATQTLIGRRHLNVSTANAEQKFSTREQQILDMLGQGMGNSEIATTLEISVRTVETYCVRVCTKLKLAGMKELRQFAIRNPAKR